LSAVVTATPHIARRFANLNQRTLDINNYPMQRELADGVQAATAGSRGLLHRRHRRHPRRGRDGYGAGAGGRYADHGRPFRERRNRGSRARAAGLGEGGLPRHRTPREEVRRIMAESRAGLLFFHPEPNHVDAQPNKMFEYMSAGLPVLASDFPLWRSLLEDSGAGRCADPRTPQMPSRIASPDCWTMGPVAARRLGELGREAVNTVYHWAHEEKKLVNLYRELLA
jgi:glycosyltransferase involved in cell wall biosynthesis